MYGIIQFFFYSLLVLFIIHMVHLFYDYTQSLFVDKIKTNVYKTQVEKYKALMKEIENEHKIKHDKIDMESELINFVEKNS